MMTWNRSAPLAATLFAAALLPAKSGFAAADFCGKTAVSLAKFGGPKFAENMSKSADTLADSVAVLPKGWKVLAGSGLTIALPSSKSVWKRVVSSHEVTPGLDAYSFADGAATLTVAAVATADDFNAKSAKNYGLTPDDVSLTDMMRALAKPRPSPCGKGVKSPKALMGFAFMEKAARVAGADAVKAFQQTRDGRLTRLHTTYGGKHEIRIDMVKGTKLVSVLFETTDMSRAKAVLAAATNYAQEAAPKSPSPDKMLIHDREGDFGAADSLHQSDACVKSKCRSIIDGKRRDYIKGAKP